MARAGLQNSGKFSEIRCWKGRSYPQYTVTTSKSLGGSPSRSSTFSRKLPSSHWNPEVWPSKSKRLRKSRNLPRSRLESSAFVRMCQTACTNPALCRRRATNAADSSGRPNGVARQGCGQKGESDSPWALREVRFCRHLEVAYFTANSPDSNRGDSRSRVRRRFWIWRADLRIDVNIGSTR